MLCRTDPGRPLATELLQLLASTQSSPADARSKVDALLDQLTGLDSLEFNEQLLQGGPWRVGHSRPKQQGHCRATCQQQGLRALGLFGPATQDAARPWQHYSTKCRYVDHIPLTKSAARATPPTGLQ